MLIIDPPPGIPRLRPAHLLAPVVAVLLAAACGEDSPQGPAVDAGGPASVAVTASIEAAGDTAAQQSGGGLGAAFDAADVAAVRVTGPGGSVLADREVDFDPGSGGAELSLELTIEDDRVPVTVELALRRGADRLFEGSTGLTLVAGETTTAELGLEPVPAAVSVPEGPVTFTALGDTAELDAAVVFATGDTIPGLAVTWSSGDPAVADVSEDGTVVADAPGETEAVATHEGLSASVAVEVDPEVATVAVEPDSAAFSSLSDSRDFSVQVTDANGNPVEDEPVTWSSTDVQVAAVDDDGRAEARGDGSAAVVAEAMGLADTASVTVDLGPTGRVSGQVGRVQPPQSSSSSVAASASAGGGDVGAAITTNPAGGVEVRFLQGGAVVSRTTTASDGSWTSPAIPPGTYTLEYASAELETVLHPDVEVEEGTTRSVAEVPMAPASDQPGTVAGSVLNSRGGAGVEGATVEVHRGFRNPGGEVVASGTAGSDGSYEIGGVPAGTYTITGSAPDFAPDEITGVVLGGETFGGQDLTLVPPPAVTIGSPTDGASFTTDDVIPFRGSADDPEQGALSGDALVWTSDQVGEIGTGESFTATLPVGEHVITLTATNDRGASGQASVGITVEQQGTLVVADGDEQTADPGTTLPTDPTVRLEGASNGQVAFRVTGGGGTVDGQRSVTVSTDQDGFASVSWTLGSGPGENDLVAELVGGNTVRFGATGLPGFVEVAAGGVGFTCGLSTAGRIYCWGQNFRGALGVGATSAELSFSFRPRLVDTSAIGSPTFTSVFAGHFHVCALDQSGAAYCWGGAGDGQIGTTATENCGTGTTVFPCSTRPVPVEGGLVFDKLDLGLLSSCGLASDGTVHCWGANSNDVLGTQTSETCASGRLCSRTPVLAAGGMTFDDVANGFSRSCGVVRRTASANETYCWGQFVVDSMIAGTDPARVAEGISPTSIRVGSTNQCALAGTDAFCWGDNFSGQIGDGTTVSRDSPTTVVGSIAFQGLALNDGNTIFGHTCGIATDGAAWCWGNDRLGQLGAPSAETCTRSGISVPCNTTPLSVSGGRTFEELAVGQDHSCGVTPGGDVFCWGSNNVGQLGTNSTETCDGVRCSTTPVEVGGSTDEVVAADRGVSANVQPFSTGTPGSLLEGGW